MGTWAVVGKVDAGEGVGAEVIVTVGYFNVLANDVLSNNEEELGKWKEG